MFFNKYCKILILVLLAFLSVGAVSANDSEISELISNSTDSISIDDSVNEDTVLDSPSIVSNDVPSLRSGSGNAIYVDANASTGGDGSSTNPYKICHQR
ncbi:hypothetical protein [Methanobrevibacter sp.]|uniref:hypothetical protein n=1 Tax=Methanobrevibacter sp. TaxID=66852 RepID=UPI003D7E84FA